MAKLFFGLILAVEIFALGNRGGGPLLSHLFLTGAVFLIVCLALLHERIPLWNDKAPNTPWIFYVCFFLFFLISLVTSRTPEFGLSEFLLFANAGILLFIFSRIKISEKDFAFFSVALIALAVSDTLVGYFIYTGASFPRFAGTFLNLKEPYTAFGNDFANFILLILPLAFAQLFKKHERPTTTPLAIFACSILLSGFLLSFSRAAWLSFFGIIILAIIWMILQRRAINRAIDRAIDFKKIGVRLSAVLILAAILINGLQFIRGQKFETTSLLRKLTFQADEGTASASERIAFWDGAVKLIKDQPFFGSGVLSFKYLYPKYQKEFGVNWDHPHNIFLKIGVENGIFAALFFGLFLITSAIILLRFFRCNLSHPSFALVLGSFAAFGHNLLDFNFIVANFTLFIVFIAIGLNFSATENGRELNIMRALFIGSLILLLLGLHEGFYNIDFKKGRRALAAGEKEKAVILLHNAENLIFKRDLWKWLAKSGEFKAANDMAANDIIDAELFNKLGELAMHAKNYKGAEAFFAKAIELDPMNYFRYYYNLFDAQKRQGKKLNASIVRRAKALLRQYAPLLRENKHFTVITDNPGYASKLYEIFGMKKEKTPHDKIWLEELIKFISRYGAPPPKVI